MAISATVSPGKIFSDNESITIAKLNALGTPTVDISGAVGTLAINDNTITDAKIQAGAKIQFSKMEPVDSAKIIVGNSSNVPTAVAMSGDATISNTGAVTVSSVSDNAITPAKMEDGTQGDILIYGADGAPERLTAGTSGQYLKTQGADASPVWGTIEPDQAIKAIVVANSGTDTHYGAGATEGSETLETGVAVTLDASTDYILDCSVNLIEDHGGSAGTMDGEFLYSVDSGTTWTKFADVKQFDAYANGGTRAVDITFAKGFTTNSSGGDYYFKFDCDPDEDQAGIWEVHDFSIRILKGPTLVGGDTHEQAE